MITSQIKNRNSRATNTRYAEHRVGHVKTEGKSAETDPDRENRGQENDAPYYNHPELGHDYSDKTYTGWSPRQIGRASCRERV